MSGLQSLNLTNGGLETCLMPDVTNPQQHEVIHDQEEPEINVVGLDTNEHITSGEAISGIELGRNAIQSQLSTSPSQKEPAPGEGTCGIELGNIGN